MRPQAKPYFLGGWVSPRIGASPLLSQGRQHDLHAYGIPDGVRRLPRQSLGPPLALWRMWADSSHHFVLPPSHGIDDGLCVQGVRLPLYIRDLGSPYPQQRIAVFVPLLLRRNLLESPAHAVISLVRRACACGAFSRSCLLCRRRAPSWVFVSRLLSRISIQSPARRCCDA